MARIKITLPDTFLFTSSIPVRITDLNYGGHVGNDSLFAMLSEARLQFLSHFGYSDTNLGGVGLILSDAAMEFRGESFYGDVLTVEVGVLDLHRFGFDLVFLVRNQEGKEIIRAKTGIMSFDYQTRKLALLPQAVANRFETNPGLNL